MVSAYSNSAAPPAFGSSAAGSTSALAGTGFGPTFYVDGTSGSAASNGRSPKNAASTFTRIFAIMAEMQAVKDGSCNDATIYWRGLVRDQAVAPLGVTGVLIKAVMGGNDRHDDGARWTTPASGAVAGQALLELREQGWAIDGGLFVPEATGGACIKAHRNEDATYPDSSHFVVQNARFVSPGSGTPIGIQDVGGNFDYTIQNCIFQSLTSAITCTSTSIAVPLMDRIIGNQFLLCTNDITTSMSYGVVKKNVHMTAGSGGTNKVVSTSFNSSQGGNSHVTLNEFSNTSAQIKNNAGFNGATGDQWSNYVTSTAALIVESPPAAS